MSLRISGFWRLLSTAVVLCSIRLLAHSPVRADPGGSSSAETFCGELLCTESCFVVADQTGEWRARRRRRRGY